MKPTNRRSCRRTWIFLSSDSEAMVIDNEPVMEIIGEIVLVFIHAGEVKGKSRHQAKVEMSGSTKINRKGQKFVPDLKSAVYYASSSE
jgi:hypothetical protein